MRPTYLALALCLATSLSFAQSGFQVHTYAAPVVQELTAHDMNRDGYADLVTYGGPVDVYLNDGHGGFLPRKYIGVFAAFAAIADFNHDGLPDIATCHINSGSSGTISIYLNRGGGSFQLAGSSSLNGLCTSLTAGDVDGDGKADVVTTSYTSNSSGIVGAITTFFGGGNGTLPRKVTQSNVSVAAKNTAFTSCFLRSAAGGDFQQAKRVDLVLTGSCTSDPTNAGTLYYATSDHAGHYALKEITEDIRGYDYFPPYASDVNGDGKLDVVLIDFQSGPHGSFSNNLDFLVNKGAGSFTLKKVFNENSYAASYLSAVFSGAAADFDGDHIYDAVAGFTQSPDGCCTPDTPGFVILKGNSSGGYAESQRWKASAYPYSTITADFNNDGRPDIASVLVNSSANSASLVVYLNQGSTTQTCSVPSSPGVHVCSPISGQSYSSPVSISATGKGASGAVNHMELWIDGKKIGNYAGGTLKTSVSLSAGSHRIVVVEVDSAGASVKSSPVYITVK